MAGRALYRAFQRELRRCSADGTLRIRPPVDEGRTQWFSGVPYRSPSRQELESERRAIVEKLCGTGPVADRSEFTAAEIRAILRSRFAASDAGKLNAGFSSLRLFRQQLAGQMRSSWSETRGIQVEMRTAFRTVAKGHYLFEYRVNVHNASADTVRIVDRHWAHYGPDGVTKTVQVPKWTEGVVGQKPVLRPGQDFEWSSGTALPTSSGFMEGAFRVQVVPADADAEGELIEVAVAKCLCKQDD